MSRPCKHAGVTCAPSTFLLNFVETCLSAMTHPVASLHQYPLVPFFATLLLMFHHGTILLQDRQTVILVLPLVSILRGEAGQLSVRCMYVYFRYFFHCFLSLVFSLHCFTCSAIPKPLFTQSSHLSCGRLSLSLHPSCFAVTDIFGNLSAFVLTTCPAHFVRLETIFPTTQYLVPTSSLRYFVLFLLTLCTKAIFFIQLLSHECCVCCCRSDRDTISNEEPCRQRCR